MLISDLFKIRALAATRSEVCLFLVFFIFGDTPSEICIVLKSGVWDSSSEALFSAEPTFVDKKRRQMTLRTQIFLLWSSDLTFWRQIVVILGCVFHRIL